MAKKQSTFRGKPLAPEPADEVGDVVLSSVSSKRDLIAKTLVEGRKMEAYAEHRTKDMKCCALCGRISFRKVPVKTIGKTDVCIDCVRALKEALDTVDQWSEQVSLEKDLRKQMDDGLGV